MFRQILRRIRARSPNQEELMRKELCIEVDEEDRSVGFLSKYEAHRLLQIGPDGKFKPPPLHRAFSVFLIQLQEKDDRILLQQRSASKITFSLLWSNSCCSHSLWSKSESPDVIEDVVRAARKKLQQELGMPEDLIKNLPFYHYGRVKYHAFDGTEWGEHEVDHILFMEATDEILKSITVNPEEVSAVSLMSVSDCLCLPLTPWFKRIISSGLLNQWISHFKSIKVSKPPSLAQPMSSSSSTYISTPFTSNPIHQLL